MNVVFGFSDEEALVQEPETNYSAGVVAKKSKSKYLQLRVK
jgi:hypothetical protein